MVKYERVRRWNEREERSGEKVEEKLGAPDPDSHPSAVSDREARRDDEGKMDDNVPRSPSSLSFPKVLQNRMI